MRLRAVPALPRQTGRLRGGSKRLAVDGQQARGQWPADEGGAARELESAARGESRGGEGSREVPAAAARGSRGPLPLCLAKGAELPRLKSAACRVLVARAPEASTSKGGRQQMHSDVHAGWMGGCWLLGCAEVRSYRERGPTLGPTWGLSGLRMGRRGCSESSRSWVQDPLHGHVIWCTGTSTTFT